MPSLPRAMNRKRLPQTGVERASGPASVARRGGCISLRQLSIHSIRPAYPQSHKLGDTVVETRVQRLSKLDGFVRLRICQTAPQLPLEGSIPGDGRIVSCHFGKAFWGVRLDKPGEVDYTNTICCRFSRGK